MKIFLKNSIGQIASTYAVMCLIFAIISTVRGVTTMPIMRFFELFILAVIGGVLMEFAFGKCVFKQLSDIKRVSLFIAPFAVITFLCAVIFQWITEYRSISVYLKFIGIFLGCGLLSVLLFEIEHRIKGKEYTKKLKEYQNKEYNNA